MNVLRISVLTLAGLATAAFATLAIAKTKVHSNDVYFEIAGLSAFRFTEIEHSISSGQPYDGVKSEVSEEGKQGNIDVKAGRHGTKSVAEWFQTQVGTGQTIVCDSTGTFPDDLNFAVKGTLAFTIGDKAITCDNVIVAQGHFAGANNWWMGSPNWQGAHVSVTGGTIQSCSVEGSRMPIEVVFTPQTPCVNHFSISTVSLTN